uniref:Uncharacterized protein n=1 Tax=Rhizophora mucronata TaxID=61149 RepID=A0A2P2NNH7_RHIMU
MVWRGMSSRFTRSLSQFGTLPLKVREASPYAQLSMRSHIQMLHLQTTTWILWLVLRKTLMQAFQRLNNMSVQ